MYTITLSDGSTIGNLMLNGNNFVSKTEVTDADFAGKLATVKIKDDDTNEETILRDAELIQIQKYVNDWYFIIAEKPEEQKLNESITDIQVALTQLFEMLSV